MSNDAYIQGYEARDVHSQDMSANPYPPNTRDYVTWQDGWLDAEFNDE